VSLNVSVDVYRKAISRSYAVALPDGRNFFIMWRLYEQFGVRHHETGEQYAFTHADAIRQGVIPLLLCPVDMSRIE
jgi:hypothetical protein